MTLHQMDLFREGQARDRALDLLESHRGSLCQIAIEAALRIAREAGRVTSPEVLAALRDQGRSDELAQVGRRFMGVVFRDGKVWERIGLESTGSHKRPVSIWKLRGGAR